MSKHLQPQLQRPHCKTKTLGASDIAFGKVFSRQTQGTEFHARIHIKMVGIQWEWWYTTLI